MKKRRLKKHKTRIPKKHNRKHDPFFRYIFAVPENTRALLRLAQRKNPELRRMLASVDMRSLELIPGCFSNVKKLKKIGGMLAKLLSKLEDNARATLAEKIELYLGEYLDEDVVEDLSMRMSIGQALGIVTAGDRRRAAERAGLRRGRKEGLEKGLEKGAEQERKKFAARDKKIAEYLRSNGVPENIISGGFALK